MSKKLTSADEPTWGLFYRETNKDMDARKSIKVKLPIRQHIKLHALKLFTEKNISETVEKALDSYFTEMKDEEDNTIAEGVVGADALNADVTGATGVGARVTKDAVTGVNANTANADRVDGN